MAGWLYNPELKKFWTYDDIRSIALKSRYVDAYNLRGLMFWEVTGDDTSGTLIKTIFNRNMPDITNYDISDNNELPSIKFIEPKKGDSFKEGSNVIIKTQVDDQDGYVEKVEFFVDGKSIGYNRIEPFNWVWFNASLGGHNISAIVTDNNGGKTKSPVLKINVTDN